MIVHSNYMLQHTQCETSRIFHNNYRICNSTLIEPFAASSFVATNSVLKEEHITLFGRMIGLQHQSQASEITP